MSEKHSFKQKYNDSVELCIYNCGWQKCEKNYAWGPGVRDHYLVHYIISGKGKYEINGQTRELKAGDLFFARPGELVSYKADPVDPWEYCWVGFNGLFINKIVLKLPFSGAMPVHTCGAEGTAIKDAIMNIYASRGPQPHNETRMVGYLYIFLSELMHQAQSMAPNTAVAGAQYVNNAIKFVQFNYSQDISIDDIAKAVGVSRSHLYRVFINSVGQSPIDYLTGYRISEACYLLKNSQLSIAEIAISVGFFDQFYFSRVFKKAKGVPPSKYFTIEDAVADVTQPD